MQNWIIHIQTALNQSLLLTSECIYSSIAGMNWLSSLEYYTNAFIASHVLREKNNQFYRSIKYNKVLHITTRDGNNVNCFCQ